MLGAQNELYFRPALNCSFDSRKIRSITCNNYVLHFIAFRANELSNALNSFEG